MRTGSQRRTYLLISVLVFAASVSVGAAPEAISLEHRLASLSTALGPEFWDGRLLLTYQPDSPRPVRYVGVRFEHEDWRRLHLFYRKERSEEQVMRDPETGVVTTRPVRRPERDVFYLVYDGVPTDGVVRYRIVVDGLWMTDPQNATVEVDLQKGLSFSVAVSPHPVIPPAVNPDRLADGRIRLTYRGESGKRVTVAGDFNGWDPYVTPLVEGPVGSGVYTVEMRMPLGTQKYSFYVDGRRVQDPLNSASEVDADGRVVYLVENGVGP